VVVVGGTVVVVVVVGGTVGVVVVVDGTVVVVGGTVVVVVGTVVVVGGVEVVTPGHSGPAVIQNHSSSMASWTGTVCPTAAAKYPMTFGAVVLP